jgi:hypothetical protein
MTTLTAANWDFMLATQVSHSQAWNKNASPGIKRRLAQESKMLIDSEFLSSLVNLEPVWIPINALPRSTKSLILAIRILLDGLTGNSNNTMISPPLQEPNQKGFTTMTGHYKLRK